MWRALERVVVECDGQRVEIRRGLVALPDDDSLPRSEESSEESPTQKPWSQRSEESSEESPQRSPAAASPGRNSAAGSDVAEILVVDRWLERNASRLRILAVEGEFASALPRIAPVVATAAGPARSR